ncbi:MAG: RIP metalloprotease RseP [Bacteroidetes bacterium]|nr:RIP metalloprotease RseP [Bacteroidota bacterium]MCK5766496.1 RIP metalloprotease RseP [Bacteroidales bacterium]
MEIFIKIAQLLLSLSILVIFHEMGHFLAAKMFHTRVEKFYLFFNPWFSIFKFNFKGTEYGLGWLPLGGYVKISGMIDESMDKEAMKKPPQPYEFRSKPAWQRLIIMLGGVIVNVLLAMVIYVFMLYTWGESYLPTSEANKYGIAVDSMGMEMGLRNGDKIISIDGKIVKDFYQIPITLILDEADYILVQRDSMIMNVKIPDGAIGKLVKHKNPDFIGIRFPYIVERFGENSPAEAAGMQVGDKLIELNGEPLKYFHEYIREIPQQKGEEINIACLRDADTVFVSFRVPEEGVIGVYRTSPEEFFAFNTRDYSFVEAIPAGIVKGYRGIGDYLKQLRLLFSPEVKAYESVGGFITIGSIFPAEWDWERFWRLTAFLSIMLAILNVLPIPALDGGHVMFLLYEIIARRKPSDKFMEYSQIVGMILIFALLIYANGNDIVHLFN